MSNQTGNLLRKLRKDFNYTLQDVANLLGVSKPAVSKWEAGDDITIDHLYDLSKLYGISFSELYQGKLINESNEQYWKRNYDLSNYEFDEITSKNIEDVKVLFDHIKSLKEEFYKLLPRWASNTLNKDELEEFNFIKQYFEFDERYYSYIKNGPGVISMTFGDEKKKEFVNDIYSNIKSLNNESYIWELSKIYNFKYDYKSDKICESRNLKALEYMLSSFSQIEKDSLLYVNLTVKEKKEMMFGLTQDVERDRTVAEIEQLPYFKVMLNSGANVLYQYKSHLGGWDKEQFDFIEGKAVEIDETIYKKYNFSNVGGQTYVPILKGWKLYSYDQYLEFIDHNTTNYLRDIVNLKDNNPLKYFENIIKREYTDVKSYN